MDFYFHIIIALNIFANVYYSWAWAIIRFRRYVDETLRDGQERWFRERGRARPSTPGEVYLIKPIRGLLCACRDVLWGVIQVDNFVEHIRCLVLVERPGQILRRRVSPILLSCHDLLGNGNINAKVEPNVSLSASGRAGSRVSNTGRVATSKCLDRRVHMSYQCLCFRFACGRLLLSEQRLHENERVSNS